MTSSDMAAIKKLLDVKYANSSDDIPHEDFFGTHKILE